MPTRQLLTRVPRKLAAVAGFDLVRRDEGSLRRLAAAGIEPRSVLDVGAALGDWSRACAAVFPSARYVLVEPLAEFRPSLDAAASAIGSAVVVEAAVAERTGERTINVHADLVGSSLLREREGEHVDGTPALGAGDDGRRARPRAPPPAAVPAEGRRPGRGARRRRGRGPTLAAAAAVICEVSFFGFFYDGTPFEELIRTMRDARLRRLRHRQPRAAPARRRALAGGHPVRAGGQPGPARARLRGSRPARRARRGVRRCDPPPDRPRRLTWPTTPSHLDRHPGAEPGAVHRGDADLGAGRPGPAREYVVLDGGSTDGTPRRSSATRTGSRRGLAARRGPVRRDRARLRADDGRRDGVAERRRRLPAVGAAARRRSSSHGSRRSSG